MPDLRVGTVVGWQQLSPALATFRLLPESGNRFMDYEAGQYIALRRERCKLTKRVLGPDGRHHHVPDLDEAGNPKIGPITHAYSVASAPFETRDKGHLEFYIGLQKNRHGVGRLSGSLFARGPSGETKVRYLDRITGTFTLSKRAAGFRSVLMVGTGTGLAPFVSMIKQRHFDACRGVDDGVRFTLLHTNRTRDELAYHEDLQAIAASPHFDFMYVPSVSRPRAQDLADPHLGHGRANNLLRHVFDMPSKEEDVLQAARDGRGDPAVARAALAHMVAPVLPRHVARGELRTRLDPRSTVILTCGNVALMNDIKHVAAVQGIRFEKEDW